MEKECERYTSLLEKYPTDMIMLGIGENAHIAFNDSPVTFFNDKKLLRRLALTFYGVSSWLMTDALSHLRKFLDMHSHL